MVISQIDFPVSMLWSALGGTGLEPNLFLQHGYDESSLRRTDCKAKQVKGPQGIHCVPTLWENNEPKMRSQLGRLYTDRLKTDLLIEWLMHLATRAAFPQEVYVSTNTSPCIREHHCSFTLVESLSIVIMVKSHCNWLIEWNRKLKIVQIFTGSGTAAAFWLLLTESLA